MKNIILKELDNIEKTDNVRIIYACESGSRAWGFPSKDSDYDVRFIYVHSKDWYLSIAEKRDVIELPLNENLDINGWDIRKSIKLIRKSNSPLLEWLSSPIVYRYNDSAMVPFVELSKNAFLPESSSHHYLSMAKNSMTKFKDRKEVTIKTYLYALRTILCCKWIIKRMEHPPMRIQDLLLEFLSAGEFRRFIDQLIHKKNKGSESAVVERSVFFEDYLNEELNELKTKVPKNPNKMPVEAFDKVFKEILGTM